MKRPGELSHPRLGTGDTLLVWLTLVHYLVFELLFFFFPDFLGWLNMPVTLWKTLFPGVLFCYGLHDAARALENRPIFAFYTLLFGALLAMAAVSSWFSPLASSGMYEWMKLPPRLLFFIGAAVFFYGRPQAFVLLTKIVVGWAKRGTLFCTVRTSICRCPMERF